MLIPARKAALASRARTLTSSLNEDGEYVRVDDEDDDDDEDEKKVMTIAQHELCIGPTACARICPKQCYSHAAASV